MVNYKEYVPLLLFIILLVLSFLVIKPLLLVIFLGSLLAYVFHPLYKKLKNKIKNKTLAALVICSLVLLILVVPGVYFVKILIQESYFIFISVKQKLAVGLFKDCSYSFCKMVEDLGNNVEIQYQIQENTRTLTNWIIKKGSDLLVSIPGMILDLFVMFFTMYYLLKDGKQLLGKIISYLNLTKKKYSLIVLRLKEIIHGIVFGYLLVGLIQGILGALGFLIFGVHSPLFWGLVMAFLALIPYLGTGLIWVPASLFLFFNGYFQGSNILMIKGIGLFVYGSIFIASLDNFLRPVLVGDKAKIHPLIILIGIFGGILIFGPFGVIIGPLILSLTSVIINSFLLEKDNKN